MDIKDKIRVIEDFPIEGISFKDITSVLQNKDDFKYTIDELCELVDGDIDLVVGPEARGFIFGPMMAYKLNAGFVPVRKPGKLPYETLRYTYTLEYGEDELQMHIDAIKPGNKVIIVDDLIATGGTLLACAKMVEKLGGKVVNIITLIELTDEHGRDKLKDYSLKSLVKYDH